MLFSPLATLSSAILNFKHPIVFDCFAEPIRRDLVRAAYYLSRSWSRSALVYRGSLSVRLICQFRRLSDSLKLNACSDTMIYHTAAVLGSISAALSRVWSTFPAFGGGRGRRLLSWTSAGKNLQPLGSRQDCLAFRQHGQPIFALCFLFNKLTSVFHASVLLLIMNFVITLSK